MDPQPLDGYAATAEALVPDAGEPPESELAGLSAAALARLVELAPGRCRAWPRRDPGPGWDHTEPGLWPAPEDLDVDLNACPEPWWLASIEDSAAFLDAYQQAPRPPLGLRGLRGGWAAGLEGARSTPRPDPSTAIPGRS